MFALYIDLSKIEKCQLLTSGNDGCFVVMKVNRQNYNFCQSYNDLASHLSLNFTHIENSWTSAKWSRSTCSRTGLCFVDIGLLLSFSSILININYIILIIISMIIMIIIDYSFFFIYDSFLHILGTICADVTTIWTWAQGQWGKTEDRTRTGARAS